MEYQDVRKWEQTVDEVDAQPVVSLLPPDAPIGTIHHEHDRSWIRVRILSGSAGGRWAYWAKTITPDTPRTDFDVIADKLFNSDAHHFVGLMHEPYVKRFGVEATCWVLTSPKPSGPRTILIQEEPNRERYERSREIYDVETGETRKI